MKNGQFTLEAINGKARAGVLQTAHGAIETPVFMPVGTKASVKSLDPHVLGNLGTQILLGNTYHLYLAPGDELIRDLGGLHAFMHWDKPILTDSGGFQVFSLGAGKKDRDQSDDEIIPEAKITDNGVEFRSHKDGSKHFFTPERSIAIQANLGADIIMAFDECPPYPSTEKYYYTSMERTHRWLMRCIEHKKELEASGASHNQLLFGIIQGGMNKDLREQSAQFVTRQNLPGVAIGGVAVGEDRDHQIEQVEWVLPHVPSETPRYLMGVGTPLDLIEFVACGIDMFDCVLPTRLARNGAVWIVENGKGERAQLKNARFRADKGPLTEGCACSTCTRFSRAYLHHLFMEHEPLAMQLASIHNIHMLIDEMRQARKAILDGTFDQFYAQTRSIWQ